MKKIKWKWIEHCGPVLNETHRPKGTTLFSYGSTDNEDDRAGIVDEKGDVILDFGNSTEYYPSSGNEPSAEHRDFIMMACNNHQDLVKLLVEAVWDLRQGATPNEAWLRQAKELLEKLESK